MSSGTIARVFVLACLLSSGQAIAMDCLALSGIAERDACIRLELRRSDSELNARYGELLSLLGSDARPLRDSQLQWLHMRDTRCGTRSMRIERETWLRALERKPRTANCVIRSTRARSAELASYVTTIREARAQSGLDARTALERGQGRPVHQAFSAQSRSTGRWYFEVDLKLGEMAKSVDAFVFTGVTADVGNFGRIVGVLPAGQGLGIVLLPGDLHIGVAVDLDAGKLYFRDRVVPGTGDAWPRGRPGSREGIDLPRGVAYRAALLSSVRLERFVAEGLVRVNFGQQPFAGPVPDGYLPFGDPAARPTRFSRAMSILPIESYAASAGDSGRRSP